MYLVAGTPHLVNILFEAISSLIHLSLARLGTNSLDRTLIDSVSLSVADPLNPFSLHICYCSEHW